MTGSVDTSVMLRFTLRDVPDQLPGVLRLLATVGARYRLADECVVEAVYAMEHHYGLTRPAITELVRAFLGIDSIDGDAALFEAVCQAYLAHPKLSFTDCFLAETAKACSAVPLWTLDKKLARQHESARLVPTPAPTDDPGTTDASRLRKSGPTRPGA